jgi:hypothetical protein
MEKKVEVKSEKKSLWSILKESMTKTSSGCGPGCGCHSEEPVNKNRQSDTNKKLRKE